MSMRMKQLMARELADGFRETDSCVVVGLGKMDVLSVTELRTKLRDEGLTFRVLKNRVAGHALREIGWDGVDELLDGPSALAFGGENGALVASKLLVDWNRKLPDTLTIRGGLMDGKVLDEGGVRQLATIPDKPTLYAMLAYAVAAPVSQIASLVNEIMSGVARAVGALAEKSEGDLAEKSEGGA
jgi:large subunit ribosomal protein L10